MFVTWLADCHPSKSSWLPWITQEASGAQPFIVVTNLPASSGVKGIGDLVILGFARCLDHPDSS